ncbi:MAG: HD domain-containing protein, partial [Desulfotomaculaceae bacterium]|nr:HD domain-containing protein [Desulfotomaculaceae bacterium]
YIKLSEDNGDLAARRSARWRWHKQLIDPHGGLADIENKTIRAISNYVFEADPARILRGARLAGKLGFSIKPETLELMKQSHWLLQEVAGERIWAELSAVLALPQSYHWITILDEIGALSELFPLTIKPTSQARSRERVWAHNLKTYDLLEKLCGDPGGELSSTGRAGELGELVRQHLDQSLTTGRRRIQLIKTAALLHDPGQAVTAMNREGQGTFPDHSKAGLKHVSEFARRLRMSKTEEAYLKNVVGSHMDSFSLFKNMPVEPAAIHRFFTKLGQEVTDILLLSLANAAASAAGGEESLDLPGYRAFVGNFLCKYYFEAGTYVHPPALVKGKDLIAALALPPSKKLGVLLDKITEAQVNGQVTNKEEAIAYVAGLLAK